MPESMPSRQRRILAPVLALILVLGGGGAAAWCFYGEEIAGAYASLMPGAEDAEGQLDKYYTVKRGDFNITVQVDGTLTALKRHDLRCEAKGHFELCITEVVEDKIQVKKDALIVRFSAEKYIEQLDKLKLDLENSERDLALAREDLSMRKTANRSELKAAYDKLRTAKEALQKYNDLEAPKNRKAKQAAITDAETKLETAEKKASLARETLSESQNTDEAETKKLEDAVKTAEKEVVDCQRALDNANHDYRVFKQYDFPQKMRSLRESVIQGELNLRKAFVDAKGKLIQAERTIQNHERRIQSIKENIKKMEEDVSKLEIRAPVAGIVTLGNPRRSRWQEPKEIKVGTTVHSREIVASIPDLSKFNVEVRIPEEYRSRVHVGQDAALRSPAIPDLTMEGKIKTIAPMSSTRGWWDRDGPKSYATKINTEASDPRLMPGMTVKVEIVVETAKNVLFIPVEAAFNREGKTLCHVRSLTGPKEREIETGRSSIHFVEVLKGLEEGEDVLLQRRPGENTG